jgi:hypothetical protein
MHSANWHWPWLDRGGAGPSLHPGGTCLLDNLQRQKTGLNGRYAGSREDDSMDHMIPYAVRVVALRWRDGVALCSGAVGVQQQVRVGRCS